MSLNLLKNVTVFSKLHHKAKRLAVDIEEAFLKLDHIHVPRIHRTQKDKYRVRTSNRQKAADR